MKNTIDARITLLLSRGGLTLEVTDAVSGIRILDAALTTEDSMAAFGRQAMVPGKVTLYAKLDAPLGYKVQTKVEVIDFGPVKHKTGARFDHKKHSEAAVAPYMRDGWDCVHGSSADWLSHHCFVSEDKYHVRFRRYVDPTTGKPWLFNA